MFKYYFISLYVSKQLENIGNLYTVIKKQKNMRKNVCRLETNIECDICRGI